MRSTMQSGSCAILSLAAAFGCGSRSPAVDAKVTLLEPTALADHVVFLDDGRSEARLLDVSGAAPPAAPVVVPIVRHPVGSELRKGAGHSGELLVLCAGQPDTSRVVTPEQPGLVVLDANGGSKTYRYDSAFDHMVQSDDGSFVFLFFGPGEGDETTLRNPNEVALINLDQKPGKSNPVVRTLRSLGQSPQNVFFSDRVSIAGADRNLAVVLLESDVAVVDLSHPERSEFTVELTKPGAATLTAAQVLFSLEEATPKIYLRAQGSDDVFAISIEASVASGEAAQNDFSLNFSQLGAGSGAGPTDIKAFTDDGKTRLLVAAPGNGTAVVIDADSDRTTTIGLPVPASQILLFNGPKPSDSTPAERALLYTPGGQSVVFLDLAGLGTETNRSGNAEQLQVPQDYAKLTVIDDNTVMLLHQSTGLSLLDLADRSLSPITGPNVVNAVPDLELKKLWLTPPGDRLGFLDIPESADSQGARSFHPNEVRLDAPINTFVRVPSAHHPKVALTHPGSTGYMTVLDANKPADLGSAYAVSGYLFEGVLGGP